MRLKVDCGKAADAISRFIADEVAKAGARGVVLGISGGLDSAVVAFLAVRALGSSRAVGLFLPERDTAPESAVCARAVAADAGIRLDTVDLTPALERLGCYRGVVTLAMKNKYVNRAAFTVIEKIKKVSPFQLTLDGTENTILKEAIAFYRLKHRLRMCLLYQRAELEGMLVAGCLNRTEYLTGFFVKYGDSAADLAPILPLYKTQVRELASYLGVPRLVIERPPTPDLIPGLTDELALGISYDKLDLILLGLSKGLPVEEIARDVGLSSSTAKRVAGLVESAARWRKNTAYPQELAGTDDF